MKALLFTDVVDSTLWAQGVGDERAAAIWAEHDRCARALLAQHGGHEIDRSDGFFLLFDEVRGAALFARDYHLVLADLGLQARVGLHLGTVTQRTNPSDAVTRGAKLIEVEGLAKPFAARVMALARGGQTLLSGAAADALQAGGGAVAELGQLQLHGHYRLKGIDEPAAIHELGPANGAFAPPADSDKAYRVLRVGELWQPARDVPHNLAPERDAFVGRAVELRELASRLGDGARLVTVTGPGGTGKTRLVRRLGAAWRGDWPGGVYFCDLSEARSAEGIQFAVAQALGVPLAKGDGVVQLGHAIAARARCLVILDNFEQVQMHAEATLGRWLDRAPQAAFVATSRETLHLGGETVLPVAPLPLDGDALMLFELRARAQRPGFSLDDGHRAAVAEIVRLLDGLPLAIELAAARVRVLSPAQIVERLRDRFVLLAGARGAAARQATLKATIDWSWDLLAPWEQAALAQCSVFEGGFRLEAAEAVLDLSRWPEAPPALDAIQALVDKSLVRAWLYKGQHRLALDEPYFGMYLSIHAYARDKLEAAGAATPAEARHGAWFAATGNDEALAALAGPEGVPRRRALVREADNLELACRRALQRQDAAVAGGAYRALWEALQMQGPFGPCLALGPPVLALPTLGPMCLTDVTLAFVDALQRSGRIEDARSLLEAQLAPVRARGDRRREGLLVGQLAHLDREQGRMDSARAGGEAALALHREVGNTLAEAAVLHNRGNLLDQLGEPDGSRACHEAALALYTRLGHRVGQAHVHSSLGILNRHQGRMVEAVAHYQAALAVQREFGDRRSEGIAIGNLANVLVDQGHLAQGVAHMNEALAIHREIGSRVVEPYVLANLGLAHARLGRHDLAREHYELALAIDREVHNRFHEAGVLGYLGSLEIAEGRFEQARPHLEQALQIARETGNRREQGTVLAVLAELERREQRRVQARAWLAEGEALLRQIDNPFELANLLCVKARVAVDAEDPCTAGAALAEAEQIAAAIEATVDSGLATEIADLRKALG